MAMATNMVSVEGVFSKYFPGSSLKPLQKQILKLLIDKKHVLGILPTGYGKSLTFALLPALFDEIYPDTVHMTVVISPLKSLMRDQAIRWNGKGISSLAYTSAEELADVDAGNIKLLFVSPEALLEDTLWGRMQQWKDRICALVFDEVHCIIEWGEDFRQAYLEVCKIRNILNDVPVLALTGTATQSLIAAIQKALAVEAQIISTLPDRPNIYLEITTADGFTSLSWYLDLLREKLANTPKAIIYVRTIDQAAQIWGWFSHNLGKEPYGRMGVERNANTRLVEMYHGCCDEDIKESTLQRFKGETSLRLVVATIAFGMGVDISNIRFVLHWGAPAEVSHYFQQVGRAGRDGSSSRAILYLIPRGRECSEDMKKILAQTKSGACLRKSILKYFLLPNMQNVADAEALRPHGTCCSSCDKI